MNKIIEMVNEKIDTRLLLLKKLIISDKRKIIFGAGRCAENTLLLLNEYGISIDGFCVDSEYYEPDKKLNDILVYDVKTVLNDNVDIIIGFENRKKAIAKKDEYSKMEGVEVYFFEDLFCFRSMDYRFFIDNYTQFQKAYDLLEDELSKNIFIAHINSRIAGDYTEISKYYDSSEKYGYDFDIIEVGNQEVFVDCGAFDGDTIEEFLDYTNGSYDKIFAFEPDDKNAEIMNSKISGKHDITIIPKGVGDKNSIEKFYNDGSLYSNFLESGLWGGKSRRDIYKDVNNYIEVPICRMDDEIKGEKVTFIKMDIEGSELSALVGATKTITENHPKLAICIYHKSEDLFSCVNYIHSIVGEDVYKYYIRQHSDGICETVLYAVPKR